MYGAFEGVWWESPCQFPCKEYILRRGLRRQHRDTRTLQAICGHIYRESCLESDTEIQHNFKKRESWALFPLSLRPNQQGKVVLQEEHKIFIPGIIWERGKCLEGPNLESPGIG